MQLLQGEWIYPAGSPSRTLRLHNINATTRYIKKLKQYFHKHRIREKLTVIANGLANTSSISQQEARISMINNWAEQLDQLDKLRVTLMIAAEKRCQRKGITKTYQWSVALMEAGHQITYWKARKSFKLMDIRVTELVGYPKQLHQEYSMPDTELSIEEIKSHLKKAWKHLRSVQKEDRAHRIQHLHDLAKVRAENGDGNEESIIKQLINAEQTKESHCRISYHIKGFQQLSVDYVLIPVGEDANGPFGKKWNRVQDKRELESILLKRNKSKLLESNISPFATGSLFNDIGATGEGDNLENILKDKYVL